jgi:hypothetical protein
VLVGLSTHEERDFLLKIELELCGFLDSDAPRFAFPPMNGHFRRLLHITCSRFGLDSSSSSQTLWGLDKGLEVIRQPLARPPVLGYADLIPASGKLDKQSAVAHDLGAYCDTLCVRAGVPERNVYGFPVDAPAVNVLPAAATAAAAWRRQQHEAGLTQQRRVGTPQEEAGGGRRGRGAFRFGTEPEKGGAPAAAQAAQAAQATQASRLTQMQSETAPAAPAAPAAAAAPEAAAVVSTPWFAQVGIWTGDDAEEADGCGGGWLAPRNG